MDGKSLVLDAVDLVKLVGETVSLKKAGRRYVGLCPFHEEKSPSFGVNAEKQFYYCFGCKKGGNAIDFVIERDRCDFKTALQTLADWAGIELPRRGRPGPATDKLQRLREACSSAATLYRKHLDAPEGKAARDYLEQRGFERRTIDAFGIGFAPDAFDSLQRAGLVQQFTELTLQEAGLLRTSDKNPGHRYDVLRHRVVFPIRDEQGRPIAFGGRVVPGNDSPAKYLNSPETPLFDKSATLFGLDVAKAEIAKSREVIVFEGYADVAAAWQYGVTNGVAVLGTALTPKHVTILRRFADRVILLFDADAAGESATRRSIELFLGEDVDLRVAELPAGMDPDDYLRTEGVESFREKVGAAVDALGYAWRRLAVQISGEEDVTARGAAIDDFLQLIASARGAAGGRVDEARWGGVLRRVERLTGLSIDVLRRRLEPKRAPRGPSGGSSPAPEVAPARPALGRAIVPGWQLLGSLFREPSLWEQVQEHVGPDDLHDRRQRWVAEVFWDHLRHEGEPTFPEWLDVVSTAASAGSAGEAAAGRARETCIRWHDDAADLGEAKAVAAEAVLNLLKLKEEASIESVHGDVRRTVGTSAEDDAALLRKLEKTLHETGRAGSKASPDRTAGTRDTPASPEGKRG